MAPRGCAITPLGALTPSMHSCPFSQTLTPACVGDPVPSGDTRPSCPEHAPLGTVALCSALGVETTCFRVFPEDTGGDRIPYSSDASQSATACWKLVAWSTSGLHHSISESFSLNTARCCKTRLGTCGNTSTVIPGPCWYGVFTSGSGERVLREFPWKHHSNRTFYGLSAERSVTRFIWQEPCAVFCPPGGTGQAGTESGDQARCTLSVVRHPDESLGGGFGP